VLAKKKKRKSLKSRAKKIKQRVNQKKLPQIKFKDPLGNVLIFKGALTGILAVATYRRINIVNRTEVQGIEHLMNLPRNNVLFISNHQTYYADVMALYHIFCSVKWRFKSLKLPIYALLPKVRTYYIAAEETMKKSGILPKIFSYTGAVTVRRSWRHNGKDVNRSADIRAPEKVKKALSFGWVITFPQGTTTPNAPVRKGAASIIKSFRPTVVPVTIDGFNQAFDKKGLRFRQKGVKLSVQFKEPVNFPEDATVDDIQKFLESHIHQKQEGM
jgi:1-acyl-sn-glycerol-3-phosphate acyltransferase